MPRHLWSVSVVFPMVLANAVHRAEPAVPGAVVGCEALAAGDFTTVQDAPTQVDVARRLPAAERVPAHCRVEGYVSPNIRFVLVLPEGSGWRERFMVVSPGAYGGSTGSGGWCDEALRRGYACLAHDTGHSGGANWASWAYNNLQAELDYGIRAHHVVAVAGKAIVERHLGAVPRYSYHVGISAGGKQGLTAAQRHSWDFDGILAMEPSSPTATGVVVHWNALVTHDADGNPLFQTADLRVLHQGAIDACDADDGLEDGVIGGDPRTCRFDPGVLQCRTGQNSGCLSQAQVEAARKVYEGAVTSTGEKLSKYFPFYPPLPGSEMGGYFTRDLDYKTTYWQFMGFSPDPGPTWTAKDFDFDRDYQRVGTMDAVLNGYANPDLRNFRVAGGKVMIVQGWEDAGLPNPSVTVDFYEMVERIIGDRARTQEFLRLFMIPGRSHGGGGVGASSADYLSYLEAWVEKDEAPDMVIGYHAESGGSNYAVPDQYGFTRPHYPYPLQARYRGTGDPNDYRSFEPFDPQRR